MAEWPQEHRNRQNKVAFVRQRLSDIPAPLVDQLQSSHAFEAVVAAVLEAFDITLFSLRDISVFKYGLSCNKLFDYLASGRPVISACAVTDMPVQESGGGICVPPEAPDAVADALVQLASMDPAERQAMGERGRCWVYEHHGATALAGRFLDALVQAQG